MGLTTTPTYDIISVVKEGSFTNESNDFRHRNNKYK